MGKDETDASEPGKGSFNPLNKPDETTEVGGVPIPLDQVVQAQIGVQLASYYKDLVAQPIPQKFMDLLASLEGGSKKE